jgi:membrane-associated HD superfamily phosphohydrolase
VNARIAENQLDQCPLTLRDLEIAKAEFARVLIGMYHRRIEYPSGIQAVAKPPVVADEEDGPGAGATPA